MGGKMFARRGSLRLIAPALGLALVAGSMLAPAARGAPLAECPEIMTVAQLRDRLAAGPVTGTGYTVAT
jgi:hypothetical protein